MFLECVCLLIFFLLLFFRSPASSTVLSILVCFLRMCSIYLSGNVFATGEADSWRFLKTAFGEIGIVFHKKRTTAQKYLARVTGTCLLIMNAYSCLLYIAIQRAENVFWSQQYVRDMKFMLVLVDLFFVILLIVGVSDMTHKILVIRIAKENVYKKYVYAMKTYQLQNALNDRGLPTSGIKEDLQTRLLKALLESNETVTDEKRRSMDSSDIVSFSNQLLYTVWFMIIIDIAGLMIS